MKSRFGVLGSLAIVVLLVFGCASQRNPASSGPENSEQRQRERQAQRAARRALKPPGPGKYLAFDVRPRDHRITIRYVLEITHPSGKVTTQDLKKPVLQRRSIMIPLPELEPGAYTLVVIAENAQGASRSEPLALKIPGR